MCIDRRSKFYKHRPEIRSYHCIIDMKLAWNFITFSTSHSISLKLCGIFIQLMSNNIPKSQIFDNIKITTDT